MIGHKVMNVSDELCQLCAQAWQGECRAFQMPHTQEERAQREGDPQGLCEIPVLRWGYDADHPERLGHDPRFCATCVERPRGSQWCHEETDEAGRCTAYSH